MSESSALAASATYMLKHWRSACRNPRSMAIADVNREAAEALAARCGIPKVAASAEEILADPAIEAVLICSSTDTHADLIVAGGRSRQAHLLREADCP